MDGTPAYPPPTGNGAENGESGCAAQCAEWSMENPSKSATQSAVALQIWACSTSDGPDRCPKLMYPGPNNMDPLVTWSLPSRPLALAEAPQSQGLQGDRERPLQFVAIIDLCNLLHQSSSLPPGHISIVGARPRCRAGVHTWSSRFAYVAAYCRDPHCEALG